MGSLCWLFCPCIRLTLLARSMFDLRDTSGLFEIYREMHPLPSRESRHEPVTRYEARLRTMILNMFAGLDPIIGQRTYITRL
ncbi:hypothetical protein F4808DRAFT_406059, partial [Astrocystis sublimbata]